ncbi:DUF397 domain-containing protein [Streptomyces sp. NPDC048441]|uniref:DUF397 domain-containing protein n=1 Tax=Streptomyces sp. NPDC048441 TaxID=3365552 RepID=UPI0037209873
MGPDDAGAEGGVGDAEGVLPVRNCVELATAPDDTTRLRESDEPAINLTLRTAALTSLLGAIREGTLGSQEA